MLLQIEKFHSFFMVECVSNVCVLAHIYIYIYIYICMYITHTYIYCTLDLFYFLLLKYNKEIYLLIYNVPVSAVLQIDSVIHL